MQGDVGRALRIISQAKGWDPNVIQGGESIANFNKEPSGVDHITLGKLPQGTPDSFPEDHPGIDVAATPFATPDSASGSDANRRTTNANPKPL